MLGQRLFVFDVDVADTFLERRILGFVLGCAVTLLQLGECTHGCSGVPVKGRETAKGIPCFVPEEDEVWFDRQALFHDPGNVVQMPVEGDVCTQQHAHALELAFRLQLQKRFFDGPQRHGTVHRVGHQRKRVEVERLRAGEHQAVVM